MIRPKINREKKTNDFFSFESSSTSAPRSQRGFLLRVQQEIRSDFRSGSKLNLMWTQAQNTILFWDHVQRNYSLGSVSIKDTIYQAPVQFLIRLNVVCEAGCVHTMRFVQKTRKNLLLLPRGYIVTRT